MNSFGGEAILRKKFLSMKT